jgi:hypothetical protein
MVDGNQVSNKGLGIETVSRGKKKEGKTLLTKIRTISAREECAERLRMMAATRVILGAIPLKGIERE